MQLFCKLWRFSQVTKGLNNTYLLLPMKKTLLFGFGMLVISTTAFSQSTSQTTQSNGVVVHEAIGVEGKVEQTTPQTIARTMDDWSSAECIDAMAFLNLKLAEAADLEKPRYLEQKALLQERIDSLKTTH